MICYFSYSSKTEAYAKALHRITGLPLHELRSKLNKKGFLTMLKGGAMSVFRKESPVSNMPDAVGGDVYVCAPVWAGSMAPPARFFLHHADLAGKKVNILLTCASVADSDTYRTGALKELGQTGCNPGEVFVFATGRDIPDASLAEDQLRQMMPGA